MTDRAGLYGMVCGLGLLMAFGIRDINKNISNIEKRLVSQQVQTINVIGESISDKFYERTLLDGTIERAYVEIDGMPVTDYFKQFQK